MYVRQRGQKRKFNLQGARTGRLQSFKRYKGSSIGSSGRFRSGSYSSQYFSRFAGPSQAIIRQPSGVPDRIFLKVHTSFFLRLTSASGPIVSQIGLIANSLNDPMGSSGSTLPASVASWANLYNNYTVIAAKVDAQFAQESAGTGTNTSATAVVFPATSPTAAFGNDALMSERYAKWGITSTSLNKARIRTYLTTAQFYGVDKQTVMSEADYTGVLGAGNPTALWYIIISFQGTHPTDTTTASVVVRLTQFACLWRPLNQF